jgi:hypothetical protein
MQTQALLENHPDPAIKQATEVQNCRTLRHGLHGCSLWGWDLWVQRHQCRSRGRASEARGHCQVRRRIEVLTTQQGWVSELGSAEQGCVCVYVCACVEGWGKVATILTPRQSCYSDHYFLISNFIMKSSFALK